MRPVMRPGRAIACKKIEEQCLMDNLAEDIFTGHDAKQLDCIFSA